MAVSSVKNNAVVPTPPQKTEAAAAKTAGAAKVAANAYAKAGDVPAAKPAANVQISQRAKELSLAKEVVEGTPDIREDKVAKLKDAISKGTYKPDAAKITAGIVAEAMKDELAKTPGIALED